MQNKHALPEKIAGYLRKKKRRIFDIIQIGNTSDRASRAFDFILVAAILLNIAAMFCDTFTAMRPYRTILHSVEFATAVFFAAEYLLRIWTACYLFPESAPRHAALRFIFSFDGIIELCTILPFFYLSGFVAFRMLRVVRIFHLFRINTYYDSFNVIKSVLYEKRNQLASSIFIILILMLASSLFMYSAEHDAQPAVFENAFSGIWWSMSTLLTIGYGDIYPITPIGRLMAFFISFLGVGVVAIPTGIISAGFVEHYSLVMKNTPSPDRYYESVQVDIDSNWLKKTYADLEKEGIVVLSVTRGDTEFTPDPSYRVAMKDLLTVYIRPVKQ